MAHLSEHLNRSEGHWLRDLILLTILFAVLFFQGLGTTPLMDPDEGRYAEIPREMLERGDLVTPTLNYVKYFEKPPLLYWLNAAALTALGRDETAVRLPSALAGLLTVLLTYGAGRRLYDRRIGLLGALILGSCAGFLMQSRLILTDMLLTLCLSGGLFAFLLAVRSSNVHQRRLFYHLFFLGCGLAVLAKGLIGIVLPAGILFWWLLIGKQWRLAREIPWLTGLILLLAVTAPWFILVTLRNPEFPRFFFIHEHFERFTSTIHHRQQPFWFFLPILALTMLPWSFLLPGSLMAAWQERARSRGVSLYLLLWPLVILFFFSLSDSKLIPYILPIFPPLALLIAHRLAVVWNQRQPRFGAALGSLGFLLLAAGVAIALLPFLPALGPLLQQSGQSGSQLAGLLYGPTPVLTQRIVALIGAALAIPGCLLLLALRTRSVALVTTLLCLCGLLLDLLLPLVYQRFAAERLSSRLLARAVNASATPQTLLAQWGLHQGMNFYTGRRLITVGDSDELTFGSRLGDQQGWFMTPDAFDRLWHAGRQVMIVVPHREAARFTAGAPGLQPRILADNGLLFLIANH